MQYFPLFIDTHELEILLIGGGEVASRKLELLIRTRARIRVVAPEVTAKIQQYAQNGRISLTIREVNPTDLTDINLLYIATANDRLNHQLAQLAKAKGILANVVDSRELCQFITPSIVDRGLLQIAISTSGTAPVYARELRGQLEALLPPSLEKLFDFIAAHRDEVRRRLTQFEQRKLFWERFFSTNGHQFDDDTLNHYNNAFGDLCQQGEILLIDDETKIDLLPIAAIPLMQRLDRVSSNISLPCRLSELLRRDASKEALLSVKQIKEHYQRGQRLLIYAEVAEIKRLAVSLPMARYLGAGSL